jgi:thioredoxin reductase (NADPH)
MSKRLDGTAMFTGINAGFQNTFAQLSAKYSDGLTLENLTTSLNDSNFINTAYGASFASYMTNNFSNLDSDGDGKISASEIQNIMSLMATQGLTREQIVSLGAEVEIEKVVGIDKRGEGDFVVKTEYNEYNSKAVIIAAGVKHKHLRTKSDREDLVGRGVYYCAICDGPFYKGREVAIIGDANTALQYSLLLSSYCKRVYIYTLFDKFFGDKAHVKALLAKDNIEWRPNTSVTDFIGEDELTASEYKDADGNIKIHEIPAVFVAIGQVPDNKAFEPYVDIDKMGYIIADETCKTKTDGLYVAGDCRTKAVRQVSTAVGDGAVAATNACLYVESL